MASTHPDPRERKIDFDLNKVDYEWIEKSSNTKELKKAWYALEQDGYFPDLQRVCGEKIIKLDPSFKRVVEGEKKLSAEEEAAINNDLLDFLSTANKTDQQLRSLNVEDQENKSIFSNGNSPASSLAEQLEQQRVAENERMKGNECVKSKDYAEAVTCYSRSLELNPDEAFTYCNRAMAYLKLKDYKKVIEDSNKALELKPEYAKAHHRRGKAYAALEKYEEAIKDFQTILEQEPDHKDVNRDLRDARMAMNAKLNKKKPAKPAEPEGCQVEEITEPEEVTKEEPPKKEAKKFVRVAIEESESDEEEPKIEDVGGETASPSEPKEEVVSSKTTTFPTAEEAKRLMQQGGIDFMKKFEEKEEQLRKEQKDREEAEMKAKLKQASAAQKKSIIIQEVEQKEKRLREQAEEEDIKAKAEAAAKIAEKALESEKQQKLFEEAEKKRKEFEAEQARLKKEMEEKEKEVEAAKAAVEKARKEKEELDKAKEEEAKAKAELEAAAAAVSEENSSKAPALSDEDQKKMEKQRPKVQAVLAKVDLKKKDAAEKFQLGQYGEATKLYKAAVAILESTEEDFPLFKQEVASTQAAIFNNIAVCCNKELNSKTEIEYTSKVIERQEFISDPNVLLKAYLRRGLAYEQLEKFLQAREDMLSVKQLQPGNNMASKCLNRCTKEIKEMYGDKVPAAKKNAPIKLFTSEGTTATPAPSKTEAPKEVAKETPAAKPKEEAQKEVPKETPKAPEPEVETFSVARLSEEFARIKDEGNKEYKAKSFLMAGAKFTEGINIFKKHEATCRTDKDLMTKVAQLFTNRALSWHQLDNQADVIEDTTYVLEHIDASNSKSLFRRGFAYKQQKQWEKARADLQKLIVIEPSNAVAKKELAQVVAALAAAPQNEPKIQEVKTTPKATPAPEKTTPEAEPEKESQQAKKVINKTKILNEETVNKASERATNEASQQVLSRLPKTAAGLEKDFNQIKKNSEHVFQYMSGIPPATMSSLYKTSEVPSEVLSGIISAFSSHGKEDAESLQKCAAVLASLGKASNFDMTLMFLEDSEKKQLAAIRDALKAKCGGCQEGKDFNWVYGDAF